jgi:hypothetical protein
VVDVDAMLRDLADEALAPPAPLTELERRVSVYRRRRRRLRTLAATVAVVAVALPALAVVRAGGGRDDLRVATGIAVGPTTATSEVGRSSTTTTNTQAPADGRLRQPYVTPSYQPGSGALASFRVDPAPSSVQPSLSDAQVLAAFDVSDAAPRPSGSDYVTIVRFGLFSGNVSNPPAPDGNLTGSHPVEGEPAWLVVFDGIRLRESGAARNPDAPPVDQGSTAPPGEQRRIGHGAAVISDSTAQLLSGYMTASGPAGVR